METPERSVRAHGPASDERLPGPDAAAPVSLVRDQLREYRRTFVVTGLGSLTIAIGLTVVLGPQAPDGWLGWWLAAIVGTLAPGAALRPRRGLRDDESGARRRLLGHRAVIFLHGLAWAGLWPLMHLLPEGPTHDVIAFALVGLLTGAAITLSFELIACVLFLAAAWLPLAAHFTLHTHQLGWFGPMALALFTLLLAVSAWRGWQGFLGSVQRARDALAVAEQSRMLDGLLRETRRSSAALQASQAELRAVLEAFPGYIAAIASDGRYTYVNASMAQLMGRAAQDIVGRCVEEIIPDRAAARREELQLLRDGRVVTDEMRIDTDGSNQALYMQNTRVAGPADENGNFICYAFGVDITALKEGEAKLREAKEEAERANQAKSQFLSQMSHELRTPLNAILGFGQLLAVDDKAPLNARQQQQVQEILAGAQHLLQRINGLLDIGRIEAGRLGVERDPFATAPGSDPRADGASFAPGDMPAVKPATVLYVEDNPVNALVMRAMIERMPGVQMVDCEDAETGLRLAAEHRPALILTDIQMPGMDGFELLQSLRADPSLKTTPVVAISADATPQTRARGVQAGFDDYLTKPVEMAALQAAVTRLLRR